MYDAPPPAGDIMQQLLESAPGLEPSQAKSLVCLAEALRLVEEQGDRFGSRLPHFPAENLIMVARGMVEQPEISPMEIFARVYPYAGIEGDLLSLPLSEDLASHRETFASAFKRFFSESPSSSTSVLGSEASQLLREAAENAGMKPTDAQR